MKCVKNHLAGDQAPNNTPLYQEDLYQKGDLIIRDLWNKGSERIYCMDFLINDSSSYLQRSPEKWLHVSEN